MSEDQATNNIEGHGSRVRVYFGESDKRQGKALWYALLDFLRREGASGATVSRGVAGFGAHSVIHTAHLVDISPDLPLVLEWVDADERVDALLPRLAEMIGGGLITRDPVQILHYRPHADRVGPSPSSRQEDDRRPQGAPTE
ncbi:MAG: DUF190 domain-containing protein [Chloroflexota bacterium]